MLLLNPDDHLRRQFDLGNKPAENIVKKNNNFVIPIPALGEAVHKIREKRPKSFQDDMSELDRLIRIGFLTINFIQNPTDTYCWAKKLSSMEDDDRNIISPMDALITATAITDPNSSTLYTMDNILLTNYNITDKINDWREERNMGSLSIQSFISITNNKK